MSELIPFLLRAGALASMAVLAAGVAAALPGEGPKRITRASLRLCAHRGGSALWPENTLLAFTEVSKRFPGTLLESDARLTADGQVVLMHDETVDRTTNGHGEVSAMTLAELKALDAAWHFSPDGGQTFPCRGQGITVPTFAEALEALPESLFLIEIKGGAALPAAMVELLRRMGAQDRVILASFHEGLMGYIRKTAPEIATCFTYGSGIRMLQALRSGDWAGYTPEDTLLALPDDLERHYALAADEVRAIQGKGVFVQVHTVNSREEMLRLLRLGVDSIITDHPDVLAEVIAEVERNP